MVGAAAGLAALGSETVPSGALDASDVGPISEQRAPFPAVETYLAVNPVDRNNLVASAMSTSGTQAVTYFSRDGGSSWRTGDSPGGGIFPGGDPMVAFDATGRVYLSTITPRIHVWRSDDGGETWGPSVRIPGGRAADRQWLLPGPGDHVYVVAKTTGDQGDGRDVLLWSRSADAGVTFEEPALMPLDSGYLQAVMDLDVAPDGTVLVAYLANYARVDGPVELFRGRRWSIASTDEGDTWTTPVQITENLQFGNRALGKAMKGLGIGNIAIDHGPGSRRGTVYAAWSAVIAGWHQIVVSRSPDGGRTWDAPVRVNDGGFTSDHSTPTVAVNDDGALVVTWNDRRADEEGACFEHYAAASLDGGRTFGRNLRVSERRTCPGERSRWLNGGDTQGLVALGDASFRTIWAVGSGDDLRLWTAVLRIRGR